MNIRSNMEIKDENTNTLFAKYKIKVFTLYFILFLFLLICIAGLIVLDIYGISALNNGSIQTSVNSLIYAIFISSLVILFALVIGMLVLLVSLSLLIKKHKKTIEYYQAPRFSKVYWETDFDYDYKVFQTAAKHTFHSMVLKMQLNGEKIQRKSRPIYTNSKKIGLVKIPYILQSNSFVNKSVLLGYDSKLDEIVVINIK